MCEEAAQRQSSRRRERREKGGKIRLGVREQEIEREIEIYIYRECVCVCFSRLTSAMIIHSDASRNTVEFAIPCESHKTTVSNSSLLSAQVLTQKSHHHTQQRLP